MNILLTGALGFIGSNLSIRLLNEGHNVVAFDNLSNAMESSTSRIKSSVGDKWANFKFYKIDIRSFEAMYAICANEQIDIIINLAALGSVPRSLTLPAEYVDVNERGFVNVCRLATHLGIRRVVYASSSSVYGDATTDYRTEGQEGKPLSPYAISKLHNELFANVWVKQTGIEFVGLRFFNVYGPGQNPFSEYSAVIPKFICTARPQVNGDGTVVRDYTFVDDVCSAIIISMTQQLQKNSIVCNIGTGQGTSLNGLLVHLHKLTVASHGSARPGDVQCSIASTTLAEELLGFKAETKLKDGLKMTEEYFKRTMNNG